MIAFDICQQVIHGSERDSPPDPSRRLFGYSGPDESRWSPTRIIGGVHLTVLGSSGTYPTPGNPASSYLITAGSTNIWCDAGPGSYGELTARLDLSEIDGIVISHEHPDHCSDVFAAFHSFAYGPTERRSVPLMANQVALDRIRGFVGADPSHQIEQTFHITSLVGGASVQIGEVQVTAVEVEHSVGALGFRFEHDGRALFYSGDTGPGGGWPDQVGPVDLLLCEATLQSDSSQYTRHLTASQAGKVATDIGATRLLLTHIPPHLDRLKSIREAEATFGKTVMVAVPGSIYEV